LVLNFDFTRWIVWLYRNDPIRLVAIDEFQSLLAGSEPSVKI
jgi:hypothetical protein